VILLFDANLASISTGLAIDYSLNLFMMIAVARLTLDLSSARQHHEPMHLKITGSQPRPRRLGRLIPLACIGDDQRLSAIVIRRTASIPVKISDHWQLANPGPFKVNFTGSKEPKIIYWRLGEKILAILFRRE
jgi:hypothetical protein